MPDAVRRDPKAIEILRVWASNGKQHVSLNAGLWEDPANWGIMLVDLATHIANAFEQSNGMNHAAVLRRVKSGFDAEWGSPTDTPGGNLLDG